MPYRLTAGPLEAHTKGEMKRLRHEGRIPVSIQHKGRETLHLQEEAQPLEDFIRKHGASALVELEIEPEHRRETVLVHDIQRDPVSHRLLQVTYQSVSKDEKIKTHVPLVFRGEPDAVRQRAAMVQHPIEEIEIACLPADLPSHITVDVSRLAFGGAEVMRVGDLPKNDHYETLTPPDTVIASLMSVTGPATAEVIAEETAEAQAETEGA